MADDDVKTIVANLIFGFVIGIFIGVLIGGISTSNLYQKEAIKLNYAEYNNKTGEWKWKENINND